MAIRTRRKIAEPTKRVRKIKTGNQEEYYYVSLWGLNAKEDAPLTIKLLASMGLPFEWAKAPSGYVAFRINRKYKDLPELQELDDGKPHPEGDCPVWMPYASSYGRTYKWRMNLSDSFPYLYTEWNVIEPSVSKRRRRRA